MSGIDLLLDTNIAIDFLAGEERAVSFLEDSLKEELGIAVSQITRIELLSYPDITDEEQEKEIAFLDRIEVIPITEEVEKEAIQIRRRRRLKIPDALILATAIVHEFTLVTNDAQLLKFDIHDLKVKPTQG